MSDTLNLVLCAHGHLPSGSSESEFEAYYNKEIKPLVSAVDKFQHINLTCYYSGVILYWIERRHPEFFMLLEDLLSRRQLEFLGGGFYDPMLPLLPMADKIGQIEMLTTYLRKHFGKRPQGCWLPAMAWEQSLVGPLTSCGMSFTFLEDGQFSAAGAEPDEYGIFSPSITEDQGKLITVLPAAKKLSRTLTAETLMEISKQYRGTANARILVLPISSSMAYEQFFDELSRTENAIEFTTPSRVLKFLRGPKKVYFGGEWGQDFKTENCSNPRQFLAEHPAACGIYAKMIFIHTLIKNQLRGDKTRKTTALEELWKAQDSGIYRLGTQGFPGLYHSQVRKAAYSALLEAEKITRERGKFTPSLSVFDFDLDGTGEYIFQDDKFNYGIKSRGGGIFELDYLPAAWNYLDTLNPPAYGDPRGSERRAAFVDWLAPADTVPDDAGPEGIKSARFCGEEDYDIAESDRVRRRLCLKLPPRPGLPLGEIEIEKTWQLKKNSLSLEYALRNSGNESRRFVFCPQFDLSFPGEGERFLRVFSIKDGSKEGVAPEDAALKDARGLEFQDIKNETLIVFESSRVFDARIFEVRSGAIGFEEYQSTSVIPFLNVSLDGGKIWKAFFSLKISS